MAPGYKTRNDLCRDHAIKPTRRYTHVEGWVPFSLLLGINNILNVFIIWDYFPGVLNGDVKRRVFVPGEIEVTTEVIGN